MKLLFSSLIAGALATSTTYHSGYDQHTTKPADPYTPQHTSKPALKDIYTAEDVTIEDVVAELKHMKSELDATRQVAGAPASGVACATMCEQALNAKKPELCPKYCKDVVSQTSVAVVVSNADGTAGNDVCSFSNSLAPVATGPSSTAPVEVAGIVAMKMPLPPKAKKVDAKLYVPIDGDIDPSDDKLRLRFITMSTKELVDSLDKIGGAGNCDDLLDSLMDSDAMEFDHDLDSGSSRWVEVDLSKEIQHMAWDKKWRFNDMLVVWMQIQDSGSPATTGTISLLPTELVLKFARPQVRSHRYGSHTYGYGHQPSYGYGHDSYGYQPSYGYGHDSYGYGSDSYGYDAGYYGAGYGAGYGYGYGNDNYGYGYDSYGDNNYGYDASNYGSYGYGGYGDSYGYGGYGDSYGYGGYGDSYGYGDNYGYGYGHDSYGYGGYDNYGYNNYGYDSYGYDNYGYGSSHGYGYGY